MNAIALQFGCSAEGWELEAGSRKLEAGSRKPEAGSYSYRKASIGSSRDALNAGNNPKKMPTLAENPIPSAKDHHGNETGKTDSPWTPRPMPMPKRIPSRPPIDVSNTASTTRCAKH